MKRMLERVLENTHLQREADDPLSFDCNSISVELTPGEKYQGCFSVTSSEDSGVQGYVYCPDMRMTIMTPEFGGMTRKIGFIYDSRGLKEGSVCKGSIQVVSNLGEAMIPYEIKVSTLVLESNDGKIKNLFHFANLARTDWKEAVQLFYSPAFEKLLFGSDASYIGYYRGLSYIDNPEETLNDSNVDIFLELTKKKSKIKYQFENDNTDIRYADILNDHELQVKRQGWGYSFLKVETDSDFIVLDKESLTMDDFVNDVAILPFSINKKALHRGRNFGKISLVGTYQTISASVSVNAGAVSTHERNSIKKDRLYITGLYSNYRLGKITKSEWSKETSIAISKLLSNNPNDIEILLYQVHLRIIQKREEEARKTFEKVKEMLSDSTSPELVGYSLLMESLLCKDEDIRKELSESLEILYVQNKHNWRLAWIMLYMKEDLIRDRRDRWKFLKGMYEDGCNSPLLFIEVLGVLIEEPSFISGLSDFELAFINFAIRHKVISGDIRNRFAFVSSKEVAYSAEIFRLLVNCYEMEPSREILAQICSMLMKGNRTDSECFRWYEKAVEEELRINRLYEYYIMSIDLDYSGRLPKIVLLYFAYRSNLDYERNAFLYANVLKHKPAYQDIYKDYLPKIKEFAYEQIHKRRINENLAFIYKAVIGDELYSDIYAEEYARAISVHRIRVNNPQMKSLVVVNDKLRYQERYAIYNGTALISLMGENSCILLEDEYGNKYADTSMYTINSVVRQETDVKKVMTAAPFSLLTAMYLSEDNYEEIQVSSENEEPLLYLTENPDITDNYRNRIMISLANYYFDSNDIAKLDELLLRFDAESLEYEMRENVIKIMVARGMYDRALEWIKDFGTEYIDYKILVRLCDRLIARYDYEYDRSVLGICEAVFESGKYDETVLEYLLLYKQGASKSLKVLWRAADSFGLDTAGIIENMVVQLLFSGEIVGEETNIFEEFISKNLSTELELKFLDKLSYLYFVKEQKMDDSIFDRCVYLHQMDENLSDYIKLAFLKHCKNYLDKKRKLNSEEKALTVLFIKEFCNRHMIFPFFMSFKNIWSKLSLYDDRRFVEYHGKEGSRVMLHYIFENDESQGEEYCKEEMVHFMGGIYIKSFVIFYGERVRYYITEENARTEKMTMSGTLDCGELSKDDSGYRYSYINNIAISREMKDDNTFLKVSEEYVKKCYLAERLFKPAGSED